MSFKNITKEQIANWKAKHDKLLQIDIEVDNDSNASFLIRMPDRKIINAASQYAAKNQVDKFNDIVLENCVLGGDMDILNADAGVYLTLVEKIAELIKSKEATIKKV